MKGRKRGGERETLKNRKMLLVVEDNKNKEYSMVRLTDKKKTRTKRTGQT